MVPFQEKIFPILKDGAYAINLDDKQSKGTHSVSLLVDRNILVYFDSFKVEYIPQDALNKIKE